ncbi:MAG: poly-gamma-glutamate hydrolase family protein [Pseudomonadota bacterium]
MDNYSCYQALKDHEQQDRDYVLLTREGRSQLIVIAPHGGGIEPGTVDIADALAGKEHNFYAFKGIKKQGNSILHITSTQFDEPRGLAMIGSCDWVVAIHGHHSMDSIVIIGGRDRLHGEDIRLALQDAGVRARWSRRPGTQGSHPDNICNRGRKGQGVQLEFSRGLRHQMFQNLDNRLLRQKTNVFYGVVHALKDVLSRIPVLDQVVRAGSLL